ncbi:MAG TPA: endonuclease, partial [Oscillatoriaceae cyanobacterium]
MPQRQRFLSASRAVLPLLAIALLAGCGSHPTYLLPSGPRPLAFAAKDVPAGYYDKAAGLTGEALMRALHDITAQGQRDLGYDKARDAMFTTVDDPSGSGVIQGVYTGRTISGVKDHASADNQGFTTEHTWPQSLGAWGIAKDDLHAMFPADGHANTLRSNLPFGEVARQMELLP